MAKKLDLSLFALPPYKFNFSPYVFAYDPKKDKLLIYLDRTLFAFASNCKEEHISINKANECLKWANDACYFQALGILWPDLAKLFHDALDKGQLLQHKLTRYQDYIFIEYSQKHVNKILEMCAYALIKHKRIPNTLELARLVRKLSPYDYKADFISLASDYIASARKQLEKEQLKKS